MTSGYMPNLCRYCADPTRDVERVCRSCRARGLRLPRRLTGGGWQGYSASRGTARPPPAADERNLDQEIAAAGSDDGPPPIAACSGFRHSKEATQMAKNSGNPGDVGILPGYTMDPRACTAEGSAGSAQYGAGSVQAHQDAVSATVVGTAYDNNGDPFKSAQAPAGQISVYTGDSQEPGQLHEAISGLGPDAIAVSGAGKGAVAGPRHPNAAHPGPEI